jgi:cation diffusion facilitator CzcD-associated flavoprotein CzcO
LATFTGRTFHSARWDHDYDLRGKRVAVIGTGASAIQFVPEIAPAVARLDLYQRTAPWVLPRPGGPISARARAAFRNVPLTQRLARNAIYWAAESMAMGFNGNPSLLKAGEWLGRRHLRNQIKDRELRRKLTPRYTLGCKRILGSNTYYPALARDNVEVVTDGIAEVRERSIVTADGSERVVDAIIFGTGFHVTDAFDRLAVIGRGGRDLAAEWRRDGIQTYYGISVSGFPNLFFLLGPNTGLGHNSAVFMIESQIRYIAQAMRLARHGEALEVRASVQEEFNAEIQRKLARGVWSTGGCSSWYLDSTGVNRTIWPGFTWRYWLQTRKLTSGDFELTVSREARVLEGAAAR